MENSAIIGYTGTVGQSILDCFPDIAYKYNSKNINDICGKSFNNLFLACVPADKWYANSHSEEDLKVINDILDKLSQVTAKEVYLISTIDICYFPDEPYSINRLYFENSVKELFNNIHIIRLPGLIGKHIKKNFIYDIKHPIPKFFKDHYPCLDDFYHFDGKVYVLNDNIDEQELISILRSNLLTSLRFTNRYSLYQFFDLSEIGSLLKYVHDNDIDSINITSDPINTLEICDIFGIDHKELGTGTPIVYYKPYENWMTKDEVIKSIIKYVED